MGRVMAGTTRSRRWSTAAAEQSGNHAEGLLPGFASELTVLLRVVGHLPEHAASVDVRRPEGRCPTSLEGENRDWQLRDWPVCEFVGIEQSDAKTPDWLAATCP